MCDWFRILANRMLSAINCFRLESAVSTVFKSELQDWEVIPSFQIRIERDKLRNG